jgi:plastocyanin
MLTKLSLLTLSVAIMFITASSFSRHTAANNETANENEVVIQNFVFQPSTLTVKAGTKVTWINRDDEPHTATDTEKRFGSKALDTGDSFSTEFTKPGTYDYYCALHPHMTGKIIVK